MAPLLTSPASMRCDSHGDSNGSTRVAAPSTVFLRVSVVIRRLLGPFEPSDATHLARTGDASDFCDLKDPSPSMTEGDPDGRHKTLDSDKCDSLKEEFVLEEKEEEEELAGTGEASDMLASDIISVVSRPRFLNAGAGGGGIGVSGIGCELADSDAFAVEAKRGGA